MNPLRLELTNVRTWEHLDLELPEQIVCIVGANGTGKSSIINALEIALFGSRSLGDLHPAARGIAVTDPLVITLTFNHGGETYRVRRSYSPKGRGTSKVDFEIALWHKHEEGVHTFDPLTLESQTATNEQIEALIGITRDTFRASSFLAQGDAGAFCEAQPRARKAILANVIGLADWDIWLDRARKEKRIAELALQKIAGALERAEEDLSERSLIEEGRDEAIKRRDLQAEALQDALDYLAMRRADLSQMEKDAERREAADKAVQDAEREHGALKTRAQVRLNEVVMLNVRLAERSELEAVASRLDYLATEKNVLLAAVQQWKERERVERDLASAVSEYERWIAEAERLREQTEIVRQSIGTEHCDRCGQVLGQEAAQRAAESFSADADIAIDHAGKVNEKCIAFASELQKMPTDQPEESRLPLLERSLADAQGANARLAALNEAAQRRDQALLEADQMRAELLQRERRWGLARGEAAEFGPHDPTLVETARREIAEHEGFEKTRRAAIVESERAIATADAQLERLDTIAADVQRSRVSRDELHLELDLLAALEKACGANGVPALILETVAIPQIETEATRILGLLGGPAYACELRTLRETKAGSLSDTLDIVLLTETGEAPYESFSGGERARVAFSLRLALAQLLASRKGSGTGLLVIDELEGLDAEGVAALVGVLETLPIPRVVVVSHNAEMRDAFENTILLEQTDGRSRIVSEVTV
jgi:exonuclease SbcC